METGEILPVAPAISAGSTFPKQEAKPAREAEPVEVITDAFQLSRGRLVVEQDPETRHWIYTTLDSKTGEVLSQFPFQFVSDLMESKSFGLGLIFDTRA